MSDHISTKKIWATCIWDYPFITVALLAWLWGSRVSCDSRYHEHITNQT